MWNVLSLQIYYSPDKYIRRVFLLRCLSVKLLMKIFNLLCLLSAHTDLIQVQFHNSTEVSSLFFVC